MNINWQGAWNFSKDKVIGGVVVAIIVAALAFAVGLLQLPEKLSKVEELTTRIPTIETSVAELRANQQTFNKLTEQAAGTVKDFNQEVKQLTAANAKLEASIGTLATLGTDVRDLRKATDDLRIAVTQVSAELKSIGNRSSEDRPEISGIVFLSSANLKQAGNTFAAEFAYPEELAGKTIRDVRTRLGPVIPIQGVSMLSSLCETRPSGYTIRLLARSDEAPAVAEFLQKQPIRVEVIYVLEK